MKKKIAKFIHKHPMLAKIVVYFFYTPLYKRHAEEIEKSISDFKLSRNITESKGLKRDILFSMFYNRVTGVEYFLFDFYRKNKSDRRKYIGNGEMKLLVSSITGEDSKETMTDKEHCYSLYKKFYKRELLKVTEDNYSEFLQFIKKYPKFIVKPLDLRRGMGIRTINYQGMKDEAACLFQDLLKNGPIVIEEQVCQSESLGKFHPESVNTVRVVTYADDSEKPVILFSVFRMGIGGSIIDNANAGGLLAAVDSSNGIVVTRGFRENGEIYTNHPDTDECIIGATIPQWDKLVNIVKQLVKSTPDIKLVGWDFALSEQGWVLIEANATPAFTGYQMSTQSGIRSHIESAIGKFDFGI